MSACVVGRLVRQPTGESSGRGGVALETQALNIGAGEAVDSGRQGHDKSDPWAVAVAVVRRERLRLGVQAGGPAAVALGEEAIGGVSWSRELGWVPGREVVPGGPSVSQSTNICEIHPRNGRC